MKQQLTSIAVGLELPYEVLTGDLSRVNDRTARLMLNEFRRGIERWQMHVVAQQFCRPIWLAWWDRAVLAGALPVSAADYLARGEAYRAVTWSPQRWQYINPVQDVEAVEAEIRAGLKSRRDAVAERGDDIEALDEEIAGDNRRADALGLILDSDPRKVQQTGKLQGTVSANAPPAEA